MSYILSFVILFTLFYFVQAVIWSYNLNHGD